VENLLGPLFIVRAAEEASVNREGKEPDPQMREGVMMPNMGFSALTAWMLLSVQSPLGDKLSKAGIYFRAGANVGSSLIDPIPAISVTTDRSYTVWRTPGT
jgi:hypothetical protein